MQLPRADGASGVAAQCEPRVAHLRALPGAESEIQRAERWSAGGRNGSDVLHGAVPAAAHSGALASRALPCVS